MVRKAVLGGDTPTNGAASTVEMGQPYTATIKLEGVSDMLFHRWNCEGIAEKAGAAKGSNAKKTDDIESYVYRNDKNELCLPGEYLRMSVVTAAKFKQDPRSPRKSLYDLMKAAIVNLTPLASLGIKDWDFEHRCRVTVQRNGITRCRPGIKAGWIAEVQLMVVLPEYISPALLQELTTNAGRLIGLADFRPTYGRFSVKSFDVGFESVTS